MKSKYQEDFPIRAEQYAREGLDDKQIAKNLGISWRVYYEYQKRYPQFRQAIARGKAPVDFEVENALLKRALGFDDPFKQKVIRKTVIPDVDACWKWLYNRRRDRWQARPVPDLPVPPGEGIEEAAAVLDSMTPEERQAYLDKLMKVRQCPISKHWLPVTTCCASSSRFGRTAVRCWSESIPGRSLQGSIGPSTTTGPGNPPIC